MHPPKKMVKRRNVYAGAAMTASLAAFVFASFVATKVDAASADPKRLTREQETAFLSAFGMAGIREKLKIRRADDKAAAKKDHNHGRRGNDNLQESPEDLFLAF